MDTSLENTWKTIIDRTTVDDTELTYKTISTTNKSDINELPTISLSYFKKNKPISPVKDTITITLPDEIDTMAPTEQTPIRGDISEDMTMMEGKNQKVDVDLDMDSVQPTFIENFYEEDDDESEQEDFREEDTVVLPLVTHNKVVNKRGASVKSNAPSFEIYEEIARGGMGIVLKGQQNSLKRSIAVKKLIDESEQKSLNKTKFIMEARVTAYLDHPNIIPIHELGVDADNNPIITMKLVKGKSWKQLLEENTGKCTPQYIKEQLNILINVCNALSYAHSKNIIHNDLKPANIMIGEFGEVFLMDWGIAISIDENIENAPTIHKSEVDSPMGTPSYIAPELANGEGDKIGTWTDTYLLGGILYRILMGKAPHHGGNVWESIRLASEGHIPKFSSDVPEELQQICTKSLQKDVEARYQTATDFKTAIQGFQNHWESVEIAKEADQFIQIGEKIINLMLVEKKTAAEMKDNFPNPYCPLSRAIFGFDEALRIWPENKKAYDGRERAFYIYTKVAILHEDFHVAGAVMQKIETKSVYQQLKKELDQAIENAHSCVESAKKDKMLMAKIIALGTVVLGLGIIIGKML